MTTPEKPGYAWARLDDDGKPTGPSLYVGKVPDRKRPVVGVFDGTETTVLGYLVDEAAADALISCVNDIMRPTGTLTETT